MKIILLFLFTIEGIVSTEAQISFQERIGTIYNEWGFGIAPIDNNEFMLFAVIPNHFSDSTFALIRIDSSGNVRWAKDYSTPYRISCRHFIKTSDNNFIVFGDAILGSDAINSRLMLLKIDTLGNIVWHFNYAISNQSYYGSIHETADKGFILASFSMASSFLLTKVDSNGVLQWCKSFSIPNTICWYSTAAQIADNGYLYYGGAFDRNTNVLTSLIMKFDSSGNMVHSYEVPGGGSVFNQSDFYKIDSDAYLLPCISGNICFDSTGNVLWEKRLNGTVFNQSASCRLTNNNIAITGDGSNSFPSSFLYLEIDSTNSIVKSKMFASGYYQDYALSICPSGNNGAAITGYSYNSNFLPDSCDIYLVKVDSNGVSGCNEANAFSSYHTAYDSVLPIVLTTTNKIPLAINDTITITPLTINQEIYCISTSISGTESVQSDISISPNPFTNELRIYSGDRGEVMLYDLTGKEILRHRIFEGETTISEEKISPGVYLLRYLNGKTTVNFKVLKQ